MSIHWGGKGPAHVSRWSPATTGVPSLALDFLSGTLDSRISFSRASTATVIDSSGSIQSSPVNSPRFDFDPTTLARRGLLIEESRTNLLTNSLISGVPLVTQNVTVTAVPHTLSFYGTGTVTLTGVTSATVTGTGAYPNRRTITFTPTAGVLICTVVGIVQFAQLEIGAFATSFIPTDASPVARSADIAVMTGTNFSSWYNPIEGTFVASASTPVATSNRVLDASAGIGARVVDLLVVTSAGANMQMFNGTDTFTTLNALTLGIPFKTAGAYRAASYAVVLNGGAPATSSAALVNTANALQIGRLSTGTGYLNGHIRQIAYYNTRLLNTQLISLTS